MRPLSMTSYLISYRKRLNTQNRSSVESAVAAFVKEAECKDLKI